MWLPVAEFLCLAQTAFSNLFHSPAMPANPSADCADQSREIEKVRNLFPLSHVARDESRGQCREGAEICRLVPLQRKFGPKLAVTGQAAALEGLVTACAR